MAHHEPLQLLYLGTGEPDLSTSAHGPFIVHPASSLAEATAMLTEQSFDALWLGFAGIGDLTQLANWPPLARALTDAAVLVCAPEPEVSDTLRLVRLGVQDVLPLRAATAENIARSVRMAVERKRLERAARSAFATDLNTGLPNRAQLMEHMTHLLALREREPAAMALLALRVQGLAHAESRLGVEAANVLRRKLAVRLRSVLRASDVVAALGGDGFAVLLAWIDEAGDGERVAGKLADALHRPVNVAGEDLGMGVAIGVARYPEHGKDAAALMTRALALAESGTMVRAPQAGTIRPPQAANDEL
ncbi:MAG: diguanylate cyclase domain-containing protein [Aquabacterium sp.]